MSTRPALSRVLAALGLPALLALLASAPIGQAQGVPSQPSPPAGISVLGSGLVLAQPNTVRITLGVEIVDASLATAQAEASRRMDAVIARLKNGGIADTDIHTVSYSINPQYDGQRDPSQGPPALRGYQVQNLVEVRSTNTGGLGALIDDVVGAGATRVYGIRFEADNLQGLKDQAREQAMQNARAKAEQLARDGGLTLGRPVAIEESDPGGAPPVRAQPLAVPQAAAPAPSTPIQPGELQVSTTVRVVYSIQ